MKKVILFLSSVLATVILQVNAQSPGTLSFQGIARDSIGTLVSGKPIKVRASIRNASSNGTIQFSEVRNASTNANGLFDVEIGAAGFVSRTGTMAGVSWGSGSKFLQIEMDVKNGSSFKTVSNQQMVSVPFAKFASTAQNLTADGKINPAQIAPAANSPVGLPLRFDGSKWTPAPAYTSAGTLQFPLSASTNMATGTAFSLNTTGGFALKLKTRGPAMIADATTGTAVSISNEGTGQEAFKVSNPTPGGAGLELEAQSGTAFSVVGGSNWDAYALALAGKIKIAGGNTNPRVNALLTSDASGNAVWKKDDPFAFGGTSGPQDLHANAALASPVLQTIKGGYFGNAPMFVVPASGVYSLSVKSRAKSQGAGAAYNLSKSRIKESSLLVRVERNGTLIQTMNELVRTPDQAAYSLDANLNSYFNLKAGDVVKVECRFQFDYDGTYDPLSLELLDIKGALVIPE